VGDGQAEVGDTGGADAAVQEVGDGAGGRRQQAVSDRGGGRRGEANPDVGFKKASASEEIFELKGWNEMDGSWRAL
jgi:hypothetical protein